MQEHLSQIKICKTGTYICKQAKLMNKRRKSESEGVGNSSKIFTIFRYLVGPLITGRKDPDYRSYFKCFKTVLTFFIDHRSNAWFNGHSMMQLVKESINKI